jgi:integrase
MGGALRCYLRFRDLAGDPVGGLIAAIPSAAHWRLATLPDVLSQTEVEQLLKSFDGPLPSAKRAYAMVRCLADLGLRASEAAHLQLDDIDWRAGTLRLAKGKSRRVDILPLPPETGRAIAEYLRTERPLTANRAVFVRHVAPYDEPIAAGVVRRAVREAYRRCGWTRSRVHTLRHSVASRLLQQGTPLKEIADILRHRSLDTSAIYAKVDTNRLAAVALPWPGRAS